MPHKNDNATPTLKAQRSTAETSVSRDSALRFLPLSEPMFLILMALESENLHGYGILQAIKTSSAGEKTLRTGTLYNALARLERQALVTEIATDQAPTQSTGAPSESRGRTYRVTRLGSAVFEAESRRLASLLQMANATAQGASR